MLGTSANWNLAPTPTRSEQIRTGKIQEGAKRSGSPPTGSLSRSAQHDRLPLLHPGALRVGPPSTYSMVRVMSEHEEWREIDNYDGRYMVSSHGRVKAVPFIGPGCRKKEIVRKLTTDRKGYSRLHLNISRRRKSCLVHRLVAQAFIPMVDGKEHVNHIDGDKLNNRVENLEWVTVSENRLHSCRVLKKQGRSVVGRCLLTGQKKEFSSMRQAHENGFDRTSIFKCVSGQLASHRGFTWSDAALNQKSEGESQ